MTGVSNPELPVFRIKYLTKGTEITGLTVPASGYYAVGDNRPIIFGPYEDPLDAGKEARKYCINTGAAT